MGCEPEELLLDGIPALRWGEPGGRAVIGVHGQFSNKRDPVMAQCGDVIASRGDQLITFDLPTHGDRQDDKAFNPMEASPEVRTFAQLARSQSTEIGLLANSIGAYFSLCDTPAGTFERAWLVSPLLDLECYIRDMMAEYSVTDEQLEAETEINTPRGVLEWPYLRFVEKHPARLDIPVGLFAATRMKWSLWAPSAGSSAHPGSNSSRSRGGQHFLGRPPYLDTVVAWFEERYPA